MQTFLPYQELTKSVMCLDNKRLGKQRVEAMQIIHILEGKHKNGWQNHPAVLMWKDYETTLKYYHDLCIAEWIRRGFKNTMKYYNPDPLEAVKPHWLTEEFCASHRSNLLRKDYIFYSQYGWSEPNDLPYVWPVKKGT